MVQIMKDENIMYRVVKKSEKFVTRHDLAFKSIFVVFFVLFLALQPALLEGDVAASIPHPRHDFGVFEEKDALLYNLSSLGESTEIASNAEAALDYEITDISDSISTWDGISDILSLENLTLPDMSPPGIFEKARDFGVNSILDTLLDGRSYYIHANSSNNPNGVWVDQWSVSDPLKRPVIHGKLITNRTEVELLDPTPVDIDSDGTDDVEIELVIEATVDGGLTTIFDDPLGSIPIPSIPGLPHLGDRPPNVRITYPPTNNWIVGRSLISDTWRIGGWTWEFDLEAEEPEIERVVVAIDNKGKNATWQEAQLSKIINPPNVFLNWFRWTFDLNLRDLENGMHTIYVRSYEGNDYSEDSVNILVSNPVYRGVRLLVNVDKINSAFDQSSEINILKPISHGGARYVWSLGMKFENITDHFTAYVRPETISLVNHLPSPGGLLSGSNIFESMQGPYFLGWKASEIEPGFELSLSHFTVTSSDIISERTWLIMDFPDVLPPKEVELTLKINGTFGLTSEISMEAEMVRWNADRVSDISLTYHDEREDETVHLNAQILGMPEHVLIEIENQSAEKPYDVYTALHFSSSSNIENIIVNEYIFKNNALEVGFGVNITQLPMNFFLKGTFSALGIQSPSLLNLSGSYTFSYLWDLISIYIGRVLAQVAQRVVSLPMRFFQQSLLSGEYILTILNNEEITSLEFFLTDSQYPQLPGNFLCIYNTSLSDLSLAGRLYGISHLFARSNESNTHLEADMNSHHPFRLVNSHGDSTSDFQLLFLENIPSHLTLSLDNTSLSYSASEIVGALEFMGDNQGLHLFLKISEVPRHLNFTHTESEMILDAFEEHIGTLEFQVSESQAFSIDGDYLMFVRESNADSLSGRISNLKRLHYKSSNETSLSCSFTKGKSFRLVGRIESEDINENLNLDVFMNSLPDELSLSFQNNRMNTTLNIPEIHSISGISDVSNTLSSISSIGEDLLDMMMNITTFLTNELSTFSGGFSIYYSFEEEYDLNLIAKIEYGDISQIENPIWTHGISVRGISQGPLSARIFLSNLPQSIDIDLRSQETMRGIYFEIVNFSPDYDWFLMDIEIIDELEIMFYADNLKGKIDSILLNSTFELSSDRTSSQITGNVRSEYPLQNVYLTGKITDPFPTKIEMMVPEIPKSLALGISAENDIILNFSASQGIRFLLLNVSRYIENNWYEGAVIVHDVPTDLDVAFKTNTKYTKNSPLVGMPTIFVNAASDTTDLYMNMDGRVFGRRGSYEVFAQDIKSGLHAYLDNDTYRIKANSLGNFIMEVRNMPLMPLYKLESIKLQVKDLRSINLKILMGAGFFPAIQLEDTQVGNLKIAMSQEMSVLGAEVSPNLVLSETTLTEINNPHILVPFKSPTHINGLSTTLSEGRTTVIFPNLFASVVVTLAPIFFVLLAVLFFFWAGVYLYKRSKGEEKIQDEKHEKNKKSRKTNNKITMKENTKKWGKKMKVVVLVLLLIILGSLIFYLFIPRVELNVKTDFVQTPSGIFVVCEAANSGTVMVEDLNVSFHVYNETDELMNTTSFSTIILRRGEIKDDYLHYFGNQFESYTIIITVNFVSYGRSYQRTFSHLAKDYMRLSFEDKVN
jgi:hypothetical protein